MQLKLSLALNESLIDIRFCLVILIYSTVPKKSLYWSDVESLKEKILYGEISA